MADNSLPVLRGKLSDPEWAFLQAYALDPSDLRAAAEKAGLDAFEASKLIKSPRGRKVMSALLTTKDERYGAIREAMIWMIHCMSTWDIKDAFDENGHLLHPSQLPESVRVAIISFEYSPAKGSIEYRFESRLKALALLNEVFKQDRSAIAESTDGQAQFIVRGRKVIEAGDPDPEE